MTIALALATLLLSVMFRADVMQDERLPKLKRLAWIWSALNLCLAVAVYHRLMIYVDFNGMTRMRGGGVSGNLLLWWPVFVAGGSEKSRMGKISYG